MNDLTSPLLVGLCDDELDTRIKYHRGVYSKFDSSGPVENALYHITPARFFHGRLPIGHEGIEAYVSEDFHHVGAVEAFLTPEKLLDWANKHLAEQEGYFYVMLLDPAALGETQEYAAEEDVKETGRVLIVGPVRVEAISRVYVASRELNNSRTGKFTNVAPPSLVVRSRRDDKDDEAAGDAGIREK